MDVESARYWRDWVETGKSFAFFLVMVGVALEFLGDRFEKPLRKIIDDAREVEIVALGADLRASEIRQGELRRDNLEMQARIQPRDIAGERIDAFVAALKVTSGQRFTITAGASDAEGSVFAIRLYNLLMAAGWVPQGTGITYGAFLDLVVGMRIAPSASPAAVEAAKVLHESLSRAGIAANLMPQAGPDDVVRITVGVKPLPELTIEATGKAEARSGGSGTATVK